jgi:ech hydrogenase subunit C
VTRLVDVVRAWVRHSRMRSPWLIHFDCGGCNGCDIEVLDTMTPRYSVERFGVVNVGDPRQGDVLVVTGPANRRNADVLGAVYAQMSEPKAVVAVGSCAAHGGIFRGAPNVIGGVGTVIPVDVFVAGCPPPPRRILAGILEAVPRLAEVRPERAPTGGPGSPSLVTLAADDPIGPEEAPALDPADGSEPRSATAREDGR